MALGAPLQFLSTLVAEGAVVRNQTPAFGALGHGRIIFVILSKIIKIDYIAAPPYLINIIIVFSVIVIIFVQQQPILW